MKRKIRGVGTKLPNKVELPKSLKHIASYMFLEDLFQIDGMRFRGVTNSVGSFISTVYFGTPEQLTALQELLDSGKVLPIKSKKFNTTYMIHRLETVVDKDSGRTRFDIYV